MRTNDSKTLAQDSAFGTIFYGVLTQHLLKSLECSAAFQADDEGSIPFTRSNSFESSSNLEKTPPKFCVNAGCYLCQGSVFVLTWQLTSTTVDITAYAAAVATPRCLRKAVGRRPGGPETVGGAPIELRHHRRIVRRGRLTPRQDAPLRRASAWPRCATSSDSSPGQMRS